MNSMARIVGMLFSGAAVRLFSIGAAIYVGSLGYHALVPVLQQVSAALDMVK